MMRRRSSPSLSMASPAVFAAAVLLVLAAASPAAVPRVAAAGGSVPPASLKLWFGERGLNQIVSFVEPLLVDALQNVTAPDQRISAAGIVITLSAIRLGRFNLSALTTAFTAPATVALALDDLQAVATMDWDYTDGPGIDWSGTAVDTIAQTSIGLALTFGSDGDGRLTVSSAMSAHVGALDIQLSGSGSAFFQAIVDLVTPVLIDVFQSVIGGAVIGVVNTALAALLASVPVTVPLGTTGMALHYGLIPTTNAHALAGLYYPDDNAFGGSSHAVAYSDWSSVDIPNYQSYDVSGYFVPPATATYTFRLEYDQRAQLDANGQSVGSLELHNPGMCWPEHSAHTTGPMALTAGQFYPLRLRYQSGCGGGWAHLKTCDGDGNNCVVVDPMALYTAADSEVPVVVTPGPAPALALAVEAGVTWNGSAVDPYTPQPLPAAFVIAGNAQALQVELEQYVFDSLLWSLQQTGAMAVAITPLTVPAAMDWALNTSTWKAVLPALYAEFPDQLFSVFVAPSATPALTIDPADGVVLALAVTFNVSMSPYPIHWGWGTVIELGASATLAVDLTVADQRLVGAVKALTVDTLDVVWADLPVFNVTALLPLVDLLCHDVLQPAINAALAHGFPLPVLGPMTLVNPTIQYYPGVVAVATDFLFNASVAAPAVA